ncbi:hypothetical protein Ocin01_08096 [Orchesella cincta]|uniref:Uncharacterized protein n=1 Tax=Orchesella cincta TaxID=48709 RepID=A0A1D2N015_ORCCI|nr:hypothetical protein Ocin01_08096 [Orchesella cincta]
MVIKSNNCDNFFLNIQIILSQRKSSGVLSGSDPPVTSMERFVSGVATYSTPAGRKLIDTANFPNHFETKFNDLIPHFGTFKIKKKETPLLMYYFKMKLECKSQRLEYATIVIGDDCDEEADARESVFAKANEILWKKFRDEIFKLKALRRQQQNNSKPDKLPVSEIMMMQP